MEVVVAGAAAEVAAGLVAVADLEVLVAVVLVVVVQVEAGKVGKSESQKVRKQYMLYRFRTFGLYRLSDYLKPFLLCVDLCFDIIDLRLVGSFVFCHFSRLFFLLDHIGQQVIYKWLQTIRR